MSETNVTEKIEELKRLRDEEIAADMAQRAAEQAAADAQTKREYATRKYHEARSSFLKEILG